MFQIYKRDKWPAIPFYGFILRRHLKNCPKACGSPPLEPGLRMIAAESGFPFQYNIVYENKEFGVSSYVFSTNVDGNHLRNSLMGGSSSIFSYKRLSNSIWISQKEVLRNVSTLILARITDSMFSYCSFEINTLHAKFLNTTYFTSSAKGICVIGWTPDCMYCNAP